MEPGSQVSGVVPSSNGTAATGGAADILGAVEAVVVADADLPDKSDRDSLAEQAEQPVPVEWAWLLLRRARVEGYCVRLALYAAFTVLFTGVFQSIRPVGSTFAVQDTLLEQTVLRSVPESGLQGFYDIASDAAWFKWVEVQLLPTIFSEEYFNGDLRNKSWGRRFVNTVSMYNTQTVPVRFRQARVTGDSCGTPAESSALARPCWGDFALRHQSRAAFGEDYGNRYLAGLNAIGSGGLHSYGTEAHVVDVPLVKSAAINTLQRMKDGLWLNEQTRVITVETSWYNANLDLSTYCRWQVEISPGGRFTPSVSIYSCRLAPYSTSMDMFRLALEVAFVWILLYLCMDCAHSIRSSGKDYFLSIWNWLELLNLGLYVSVLIWWLAYLLKDKTAFEAVSDGTYTDRPDLSKVASHFDVLANMAAFNIVFSYMMIFKYLQIFPSLDLLWRTLNAASVDTWPFLLIFISFTCGFAFAGHWMFGLRMIEFHSWSQSFLTLFLTLVGGFPYEDIKRTSPVSGVLFTAAWVLVMVMVVANMFVAILTEWYQRMEAEQQAVDARLTERVGNADCGRPFYDTFYRICGCLGLGAAGPAASRGSKHEQHAKEAGRLLRTADARCAERLRQAMASDERLVAGDLRQSFGGDLDAAIGFVQEVQQLADTSASGKDTQQILGQQAARDEMEGQECKELRKLQVTVERLEEHLRQLRRALHESSVTPTKDAGGQSAHPMPARVPSTQALPGVVPEQ